jgi:WD40 repeat protein
LQGHTLWANGISFSPDGRSLASGSGDYTIRLWDIDAGQCLKVLEGHTDQVLSVRFSPVQQSLASGSQDRTIRLWDLQNTHYPFKTLLGHTDKVFSVCFSPDGRTLASSSADETIRLWEVESGACLKILRAERLYEGLNISGAIGLSEAQKATLKALGAYEE